MRADAWLRYECNPTTRDCLIPFYPQDPEQNVMHAIFDIARISQMRKGETG